MIVGKLICFEVRKFGFSGLFVASQFLVLRQCLRPVLLRRTLPADNGSHQADLLNFLERRPAASTGAHQRAGRLSGVIFRKKVNAP